MKVKSQNFSRCLLKLYFVGFPSEFWYSSKHLGRKVKLCQLKDPATFKSCTFCVLNYDFLKLHLSDATGEVHLNLNFSSHKSELHLRTHAPKSFFSHAPKTLKWLELRFTVDWYQPQRKIAKNELSTPKGKITQNMFIYPTMIMLLRPTPFKIDPKYYVNHGYFCWFWKFSKFLGFDIPYAWGINQKVLFGKRSKSTKSSMIDIGVLIDCERFLKEDVLLVF